MKRIFIFFSFVLSFQMASAYDFSAVNEDGLEIYYTTISETEVEVSRNYGTYPAYSITVPSSVEYNGNVFTVVGVGFAAFSDEDYLNDITIPATVKTIDAYAFSSCDNLTSVTFQGEALEKISYDAFSYCFSLKEISIPASVKSIGDNAFYWCYNLTSITFMGDALESIGNSAFYYCHSLKEISIPASVWSIGYEAFYLCYSLSSVTFQGDALGIIRNSTFYDCHSLKEISIPANVKSIGDHAFYLCDSLSSVTFKGDALKSIGKSAFKGCASPSFSKLPKSITVINDSAFSGCSFEEIVLPAHFEEIGVGAFSECYSLKSVSCKALTPPALTGYSESQRPFEYYWWTDDDTGRDFPLAATLHVPEEAVEAYTMAVGWGRGYTSDDERYEDGKRKHYFQNIEGKVFEDEEDDEDKDTTSAVVTPLPDDLFSLYTQDRCIFIDGASSDAQFEVYDLTGRRLYSGTDRRIPVPQAGAYIVRGCGVAQKVMVL